MLFEGGGYSVFDDRDDTAGDGGDAYDAAGDTFVGAAGSVVSVWTYGENEPMCLTVKAFDAAPPLRLKGWGEVAEVGVVSRSGRLIVPEGGDSGALGPLPNLAIDGPGRYRVRVYARYASETLGETGEEHLVVVYPGRSTRTIVHRGSR
jgi:hypothetical protein